MKRACPGDLLRLADAARSRARREVATVIPKEVSVQQLALSCGGCGLTWSVDHDVQHVQDGHGHDRDHHFHVQLPCPDPTAPGAVLCPGCGRAPVVVERLARRASPAVTDTVAGDLVTRPDAGRSAARADAPLLTAAGAAGQAPQ